MVNNEHLALLKQGVEVWNDWRKNNGGVKPNLRGAEMLSARLDRADLRGADLRGADLSGARPALYP
jgi:uncharacterized protein YjbI with pentapeptide repeats